MGIAPKPAPALRPGAPPQPAPAPADGRIKVLMVDDQPANLFALENVLAGDGYELIRATSGEDALRQMLSQDFALVLLDVVMPRLDGLDTAAMIRQRRHSRHTPIIFLTAGNDDESLVTRGYSLGAVDYIHKPIVPEILKAKVHFFAELWRKTESLARSEETLRHQLAEKVKAEEARRDSEEKYRELFTRASDAIVLFDPQDGELADANRAALRLYGYGRREFLRLSPSSLGLEPSARAVERVQKRKDGSTFPAEISYGRFAHRGRELVMALVRDATERKKAMEAERLRERDAMQRQFVATVSHELRTPIAAIKGFAETLRRGGLEDAKNRLGFIKIIESHADRLGWLVEDLLTLAELESGRSLPKPSRIELEPFIQQFVAGIAPLAAQKPCTVKVDVAKDAQVWADPAHLAQVLQNLLDNAIKYNKKGGAVKVECGSEPGGLLRVSVRDTGIGIPEADLPLIFQQFHRADGAKAMAVRGSGLGLYIIKSLVESNGGRIWAESVKDKGSAFHFTVPLAPDA
jgi:signal transduction histidine kinase